MLKILTHLTKAAVCVAVAPVALVADLATLPESAMHPTKGPFSRTGQLLGAAGRNVKEAVEP